MKAKHRQTGLKVAIKFVKSNFADICQCKNVYREIYLLSKFGNSIFTTTLYDLIIASPDSKTLQEAIGIFIVMKLENSSIRDVFKNSGLMTFTFEHIKVITYNLLCAVNFLHQSKIMHRDLKPSNILIDESCCIRLCDFGISRVEVPE